MTGEGGEKTSFEPWGGRVKVPVMPVNTIRR